MKLLAVDFSNLVVRQHSVPYTRHTDAVGRSVDGAVGAVAQVMRLVDEHRPTHLLIARDTPRGDNFRREYSQAYKAHREDADEDLKRQFTLAYRAVEMFNWPCVMVDRHEADDVIASACRQFPGRCEVISGDKDLLALCSERVTVWLFRPGGPEAINTAGCQRILGVEPRQVRCYKALVGDKSDGISGVDGIGPKGAVKLLEHFGSVTAIYRHLEAHDGLDGVVTKSVEAKLRAGIDQARVSWRLAGMVNTLPVDCDAMTLPSRPTWEQHGPALRELGLDGLERAITGKKPTKPAGPLDLDATFSQLTLS